MKFEVLDRVRWSDCDPFGIIYYGAYIRLFQVAEEELFRECGLAYATLRQERAVWIPRKAFSAEFHSPAQIDEEVAISVYFTRIGNTALTMQFEVYRASDRAHRASGSLTCVSVDKPTMKPVPIPADVKERLSLYSG
jgi:acyl-CoA thioester hydrolase